MGNVESNEAYPPQFVEELKQYQKLEKVDDDRYGEVTIYRMIHKRNEMIIVKDKWVNTAYDSRELSGYIESRKYNSHKAIAR